jgi:hypothetical protein
MNYLTDGNQTNVRGENPGTPAKTSADGLLLPASGGSVAFSAADGAVIARVLIGAGVPGISANNGRGVNADAYLSYINSISKTAGDAAIQAWLASH